jgi:predicted secreted acid phosphatase
LHLFGLLGLLKSSPERIATAEIQLQRTRPGNAAQRSEPARAAQQGHRITSAAQQSRRVAAQTAAQTLGADATAAQAAHRAKRVGANKLVETAETAEVAETSQGARQVSPWTERAGDRSEVRTARGDAESHEKMPLSIDFVQHSPTMLTSRHAAGQGPSPALRERAAMRISAFVFLALSAVPVLAQPPSPLNDRLWVQTSADYRAHCFQVYGWATRTLQERAALTAHRDAQGRLVQRTLLKSRDGKLTYDEKPLAVIMDLDETVIDMSAYRVFLARTGGSYDHDSWNAFLAYQAAHAPASRAVPGAVDFIQEATRLGYTVVFISNRTQPYLAPTEQVLNRLGITVGPRIPHPILDAGSETDQRLSRDLLTGFDQSETSPLGQALLQGQGRKERRRLEVAQTMQPIMFVGDDLGDFIAFRKDPAATPGQVLDSRYTAIEENRNRWGREFFYIPNPMYGAWMPGNTLPAEGPEKLLRDDGFTEFYRRSKR